MRKLVLTIAFAKHASMSFYSLPLIQNYAKKCGADFHVITDCKNPSYPLFDKLRIREFLDTYDRVLCVDLDILIRPDSPDLFKMVPPGWLAMNDEGSSIRIADMDNRYGSLMKMAQAWNLVHPIFPTHFSYYNGGVILADRQHKDIFTPPYRDPLPDPQVPSGDQIYINYMIWRVKPKMYHLPTCFNQMPFNMNRDFRDSSYFIHYAGLGPIETRVAMMSHDLEYWKQRGYTSEDEGLSTPAQTAAPTPPPAASSITNPLNVQQPVPVSAPTPEVAPPAEPTVLNEASS